MSKRRRSKRRKQTTQTKRPEWSIEAQAKAIETRIARKMAQQFRED